MTTRFDIQFATSRPHHLMSMALINIQQEKKDPYGPSWSISKRDKPFIRGLVRHHDHPLWHVVCHLPASPPNVHGPYQHTTREEGSVMDLHGAFQKGCFEYLITTLRPGPFVNILYKKMTSDLDKLRMRTTKYV
ncbi:hypothetical protein JHK86_050677 [Glycine max]|nr:hypothetical protein JHK86_050677 [Glycine max]